MTTDKPQVAMIVTKELAVDLFALVVTYHALLSCPDTDLRPPPGALDRIEDFLGRALELFASEKKNAK